MTTFDAARAQLPLWADRDAMDEWTVRESRKARRLTVRVFHTGRVEIVVPQRTSPQAVMRFVERHRAWIERKRREAQRNVLPPEPFPPQKLELAACEEHWLVHLAGGAGRVRVSAVAPGILGITGSAENPRLIRQALRAWLIQRAHELLAPALQEIAREMEVSFERLVVRRQRTRWGSCSTRGTISLNCCLLFQRPAVVRYLLIHELSHTRHMNHSRRFWQCVARHCPDYERLDRELLDGWRRVPSWVFGEGP